MLYFLIAVCIVFLACLLIFRGRTGHEGLERLCGWSYAHRGLHKEGIPENSMAAFREALDHGYGVELDIHLMKDGKLAIIHDHSLLRTAGAEVNIEDLILPDLENFRLEGTDEKIPLLEEVLELFSGKAPLILELKPANNHAQLCEAVSKMLERYKGSFCVESFDPRCVLWFRKNRPQYIRGQLAENFFANPNSKLPVILKCIMSWNLSVFLTRPDFIAYKFADRNNLTVRICRGLWHLQGVTWTLQTMDEHSSAVNEGWIPIFENFNP